MSYDDDVELEVSGITERDGSFTEIVGLNPNISDWDSNATYDQGAVVRYWGKYYRALLPIKRSGWWIFGSNDSPDHSDAWSEVSAESVIYDNTLGNLPPDILGVYGDGIYDRGQLDTLHDSVYGADGIYDQEGLDTILGADGIYDQEGLDAILGELFGKSKSDMRETAAAQYLAGTDIIGSLVVTDINSFVREVRAMKPLSARQGHNLIDEAISLLDAANAAHVNKGWFTPSQEGAINRRNDLIKQLQNMNATLASSGVDPIAEDAANILRETAIKAFIEYDATVEGDQTLAAARSKLYSDIIQNTKNLASKAVQAIPSYSNWLLWGSLATALALIAAVTAGVYHRVKGR